MGWTIHCRSWLVVMALIVGIKALPDPGISTRNFYEEKQERKGKESEKKPSMKAEHKWLLRNQLGPQECHQRGSKQYLKQRHRLQCLCSIPGCPCPPQLLEEGIGLRHFPSGAALPSPSPLPHSPTPPQHPLHQRSPRAASPPVPPAYTHRSFRCATKGELRSPKKRKRNFSSEMPLPGRAKPSPTKGLP